MLLTKINQFPSIEFDSKSYRNDSDISTLHEIETTNDDDSFKIIPSFQSFPQQEKNQRHSILSSSSSSIHTSYSSATTTRTLRNSLSQFTNTSTCSTKKHLSLPHHPPLPFQNTTSPLPSYQTYSFQRKAKNDELFSNYYHDILLKNDDAISTLSSSSDQNNNNNNNSNHLSQWWGDKKRKWKQFRYKKCNNKKKHNNDNN